MTLANDLVAPLPNSPNRPPLSSAEVPNRYAPKESRDEGGRHPHLCTPSPRLALLDLLEHQRSTPDYLSVTP